MTTVETAWAVGAIIITVLTACYGKELRIIFDKIPQGFRAIRIALLELKVWKYSRERDSLTLSQLDDNSLTFWWCMFCCGIGAMWWSSTKNPATKHMIISILGSVWIGNGAVIIIRSFKISFRADIVRRAKAKLKKYGIEKDT